MGCCGLASNILGLFLFHDHGHSHGGGQEHAHEGDPVSNAEEGHGHVHQDVETSLIGDESGNIADVLPQTAVAGYHTSTTGSTARKIDASDEVSTVVSAPNPSTPPRKSIGSHPHRRRTSGSFGRGFGSVDNLHVHPASFRHDIIAAGRLEEHPESELEEEALIDEDDDGPKSPNETSKLMKYGNGSPDKRLQPRRGSHASHHKKQDHRHDSWHTEHNHTKPRDGGSGGAYGHSHSDLNMRGVFLHVMGDALGNLGVIGSALFIWLTSFSWRYYVDPAVSLIITVIILTSAIPLCKAASKILLQAVPTGMSVDEIKHDIGELPQVISCHHLHVWQLSDTKYVASLHVQVDCEVQGIGSAGYMHLAKQIRRCLHGYGIHSSTIQPEFCVRGEGGVSPVSGNTAVGSGSASGSPKAGPVSKNSKADSLNSEPEACLLDCDDSCAGKDQCCVPSGKENKK